MSDVAAIAASLTKAQRGWLEVICHTNGGGVRILCRVLDSGEVVPSHPPIRKLYEKDLIQGKSGGFEKVVHTRLGWEVRQHLKQVQS